MAQVVREIMNPELFSVRPEEKAEAVMRYLIALGITGAPVLDAEHYPIGFVSLRDALRAGEDATVVAIMSTPVDVIDAEASIESAAEQLIRDNRHRLPVVGPDGRALGFVSILDVLRALRGHPFHHPETFPHHDLTTGLTWCDPKLLDDEAVMAAPGGPGVFALLWSRPRERDRTVWSEACSNVRDRLRELLHSRLAAPPHLAGPIQSGQLFVRYASAPSARALYRALLHEGP